MIPEAEIRRLAAVAAVDPMVQDLDYALGWYLVGLLRQPDVADAVLFKGGTCLRKCYFADYRFSEDLDFTLLRRLTVEQLQSAVTSAQGWSRDNGGPDLAAAPARFEVVNDDYGQESLQVRLYYRGPLQWSGSAAPSRWISAEAKRLALRPSGARSSTPIRMRHCSRRLS